MQCPKCKATVPGDSKFCQICGSDVRSVIPIDHGTTRYDPFSTLGDLDQDTNANIQDDNVIGYSHHGGRTRVYYVGDDGLWRDKEVDDMGREIPPVSPKRNTLFCTGCGKSTPADAVFCEYCGKQLLKGYSPKNFQWKHWMSVVICCVALLICVVIISSGQNEDGGYVTPLCDTCDYILCHGTDVSGNTYELVANQTESALGYEITVGVIKNNQWLYPLSNQFPFLWEDGLFHVTVPMGGDSGSDLSSYNTIASSIYFIDSGGFLMKSYNSKSATGLNLYDETLIIFSCDTMKTYTIDCRNVHLKYRYTQPSSEEGAIISTDGGKLLFYGNVSESWRDESVYDWSILDTRSLQIKKIASEISELYPESILSEGLIFASDKCFYNTSMQKVIDISHYSIDLFSDGAIYFENGTCTFKTNNALGTKYLVTIDKSGKVLSEVEQ